MSKSQTAAATTHATQETEELTNTVVVAVDVEDEE
ncbi:hypothetical protein GA0115241_1085193 [Streptomyces sp. DpondAA-D4]|nr:hypothetical protein GA0115241_1085193 [Streptomyces sp. DpondAA-D4]